LISSNFIQEVVIKKNYRKNLFWIKLIFIIKYDQKSLIFNAMLLFLIFFNFFIRHKKLILALNFACLKIIKSHDSIW